jgi:hypothetical protein
VLSGTGSAISSPYTASTQVLFPAAGVYSFRVTVSDGLLSSTDDITVVVSPLPLPAISAGPDQTVVFGGAATLAASATYNGQPNSSLTYQWSLVSGVSATFTNPNAASTLVNFPATGMYTLRVTANLGQLSSFDEVNVYVTNAGLTLAVSRNSEILQDPATPILIRSDDTRAQRVALLIDGEMRATGGGGSLTYLWDTRLLSGMHDIQAIIYDALGIIASKTVPITIQ